MFFLGNKYNYFNGFFKVQIMREKDFFKLLNPVLWVEN